MLICTKLSTLHTRSCWMNVSIMYFLAALTIAAGKKCSGRWAVYACGSGNGKRSELPDASPMERAAIESGTNRESLRDLLNRYSRFNDDMEERFISEERKGEEQEDVRELRNIELSRESGDVRLQEALRHIRMIKQLLAGNRSTRDDLVVDSNEK